PCSSNGTRDVTDFAPKSGARWACSCSFTSRSSNARPFSFKQTKTEKAYGLFQKPSTCSTSGSMNSFLTAEIRSVTSNELAPVRRGKEMTLDDESHSTHRNGHL